MPYLCSDVNIGGAVGAIIGILLILIVAGAAYVIYKTYRYTCNYNMWC